MKKWLLMLTSCVVLLMPTQGIADSGGLDPCETRNQSCDQCLDCCDYRYVEALGMCRWIRYFWPPAYSQCHAEALHQWMLCAEMCEIDWFGCGRE